MRKKSELCLKHRISVGNPLSQKIDVISEIEGLNPGTFTFCIGFSEKHNTMFKDLLEKRSVTVKRIIGNGTRRNIRKNPDREYSCVVQSGKTLVIRYSLSWEKVIPEMQRYNCVSYFSRKNFLFYPFDILLQPAEEKAARHIITFEKLPEEWSVSGGIPEKVDDGSYEMSDIREIIFFLGKQSSYEFKTGKSILNISLDNGLKFSGNMLKKNIKSIVKWHEKNLGALIWERNILLGDYPGKINGQTYAFGGTARKDGTVFQFCGTGPDASKKASKRALLCTLHHEMFHLYNPYFLKTGDHIDGDSADKYWFTEGFTEYMALKGAWETGMISEKDFLDEMGRKYLLCLKSDRFINSPLVRPGLSATECWTQMNDYLMLYSKGALIAWLIDLELKEKGGIAPLLKRIFTKYRHDGRFLLDGEALIKEFEKYKGGILKPIVKDYVSGVKFLDIPSLLIQKGFTAVLKIRDR